MVFVVGLIAAMAVSRLAAAPEEERTVKLGDIGFATNSLFNSLAAITVAILTGLYIYLW